VHHFRAAQHSPARRPTFPAALHPAFLDGAGSGTARSFSPLPSLTINTLRDKSTSLTHNRQTSMSRTPDPKSSSIVNPVSVRGTQLN
jgi:hypothetical protein